MMRVSRMLALALSTAIVSAAFSAPASAQIVELAINDDEVWEHSLTDLALPTEIAGYDREYVKAIGDGELDIIGGYNGAEGDIVSVYFYRPGIANVSIWNDRALKAIAASPMTNSAKIGGAKTTFFSPSAGREEASAVRSVMPLTNTMISTGLIIAPYGEWFVKIRLSSPTMSVEELEAKLAAVYSALNVGDGAYAHEPAYTVAPCEKDLSRKKAKRAKEDGESGMAAALAQAIMSMPLSKDEEKDEGTEEDENAERAPPVSYCSDSRGEDMWTAYKPLAGEEGYIVAFGDAGVAASVGKSGLIALLSGGDGAYQVTLMNKGDVSNYRPFRSMPNPKQTVDVIFEERPTSRTSRPTGADGGTNTTITLPSSN